MLFLHIQMELSTLQQSNGDTTVELSTLRQRNENMAMELSRLKDEVEQLKRWNNSDVRTPEISADNNASEPVNIYEELMDRISDISEELTRLDSFNWTLLAVVQNIEDQSQKLKSFQQQLTDLEGGHNLLSIDMRRLEQEVRSNNSFLSSSLNETRQQLEALSSLLDTISQSHNSHEVQINEIQVSITAIRNKQSQVDNQLTTLESNHQSHSQQISSLQSDSSQQRAELTDTKDKVATNKRLISEANADISALQADSSQARNDRNNLKEKVTNLESFHSGSGPVTLSIAPIFFITFFVFFF